jgi:hypothetical protein
MAAAAFEYGFTLPDGSKIIHGEGVMVKDAYPPELDIPGQLQVFSPGGEADPQTPCFSGPHGIFLFDVKVRMPRHVHMSPKASGDGNRYIVFRQTQWSLLALVYHTHGQHALQG